MILTIRTDKPEAEIGLYKDGKKLAYKTWPAHRELSSNLHLQIAKILQSQETDWPDIEGVVVYKGPGSFTGLRIGISVANALAYGNNCPIISDTGDDWINSGIERLSKDKNEQSVLPEYGAAPHITIPK